MVRNAVSLGGDTDTLGAIAGAMAEGFYGIPTMLTAECLKRVEPDMAEVLHRFDLYIGRARDIREDDEYTDNALVGEALLLMLDEKDRGKRADRYFDFTDSPGQADN